MSNHVLVATVANHTGGPWYLLYWGVGHSKLEEKEGIKKLFFYLKPVKAALVQCDLTELLFGRV